MQLADVLRIALGALFQQKVRTLLTVLGVLVGTFALVVSLSLGNGFRAEVDRQFTKRDQLRHIIVSPGVEPLDPALVPVEGDMSEGKRERLRKSIARRQSYRTTSRRPIQLTPDRLQTLAQLDHVVSVQPCIQERFRVELSNPPIGVPLQAALGVGIAADDDQFQERLLVGACPGEQSRNELLVSEYLLYQWGFRSDDEIQRALGRTVRLEYWLGDRRPSSTLEVLGAGLLAVSPDEAKALERLMRKLVAAFEALGLSREDLTLLQTLVERFAPGTASSTDMLAGIHRNRGQLGAVAASVLGPQPALAFLALPPSEAFLSRSFRIAGVLREFGDEDEIVGVSLAVMSKNADLFLPRESAQELFDKAPRNRVTGYEIVDVTVDSELHVREVSQRIKSMGLREYSLGKWAEQIHTSAQLVTYVTTLLAVVALIVAAIGITNTMVMSVLERRREIGVMKAVGATDGHILLFFLIEGSLIGAMGGGLGLLAGWLVSFPGDSLARRLLSLENELPLKGPLFVYPLWLCIGVPAVACLITTLAALYPARRASRVNPIEALRSE